MFEIIAQDTQPASEALDWISIGAATIAGIALIISGLSALYTHKQTKIAKAVEDDRQEDKKKAKLTFSRGSERLRITNQGQSYARNIKIYFDDTICEDGRSKFDIQISGCNDPLELGPGLGTTIYLTVYSIATFPANITVTWDDDSGENHKNSAPW